MSFYQALTPVTDFDDLFNESHYRPVPADWIVAVTDVVDSTTAIAEGHYKHVNVAGSLGAMALTNVRKEMDFPFTFGGDGMIYVLPPEVEATARSVLADIRGMVAETFGLSLRAGIVRMPDLLAAGGTLSIARLRVSSRYDQALFSGDGLETAERLVKDPTTGPRFLLPDDEPVPIKADLTGFTCRWKDIPSHRGETVSLIVKFRGEQPEQGIRLRQVLSTLSRILGSVEEYHPLAVDRLELGNSSSDYDGEARIAAGSSRGGRYRLALLRIRMEIAFTNFLIRHQISFYRGQKNMRDVREDDVISSDFRKFDGTLKMVVAATPEHRRLIVDTLESQRARGEIYFGVHVADRALMTCLIHFSSGREVHFIDGADGGYALAAKSLKSQIMEDLA